MGEDCYRTWEALVLGCIVIVKKSFLEPLYEGLPIVCVDNWEDFTPEALDRWLEQYGDVRNNADIRHKLTHKYWWDLIKKKHEQSIQDYVNSKKKHA